MSWTDAADLTAKIVALKADLVNLENSISGNTTNDVQNYSINGRAIGRYTLTERMDLHKFLNIKLRSAEKAKQIEDGGGNPGTHLPRF